MTELDWHGDRAGLPLLDAAPLEHDIDMKAVRANRLARVREEMAKRSIGALILSDPVNIRYATGARNMQVFCARNTPSRYLLVTEGRTVLFEFTGCEHLAEDLETIDEVRAASTASYVAAGPELKAREKQWAKEMLGLARELAGPCVTIGLERMNAGSAIHMADLGGHIVDAQEPVERARAIKSTEEIKCVKASLRATEKAVARLREALRPGMTENSLWSVLHQAVIAQGGDYVETRLLNSGPRSNPWFQECSDRIIQPNELVALDTDVVGCFGYYSDFSRTFHAGPDAPTEEQKRLYQTAYEQVQHNLGIIEPGMSFKDYSDRAWDIPRAYHTNRYYLSAHGVGMTGEYPYLYHHADYEAAGYDGTIEPGMTLCVESYIGGEGGTAGVKLEEQILVTETGTELLSQFPFECELLN